MAGVVIIPPVHMTARAYEWLTTSPSWYGYGKHYRAPVGEAACAFLTHADPDAPKIALVEWWACSVEDLRAITLGMHYTVRWRGNRYAMVKGEPKRPTCDHCRVLLDRAMEKAEPKTGKWLIWYRGLPRWTDKHLGEGTNE